MNQTTNSRINAIQEKYIQAFTEELQRLRKEAHPSQGNSSGQPYRGDTFNQVCDYYNKKIKNEYINKDELQRILDEQFVLINTKVVEALNAAGNARM